ncbi:flagellar protein FliT [Paenibacillus senegalensis]|uniref:flagellar protein FliT n=1 Tax=Paenibacillus senegalensis TaxID=1465766 RepID=UPI0002888CC5|nr:flagellar protein FliT [Paenibacillus senegalensis]
MDNLISSLKTLTLDFVERVPTADFEEVEDFVKERERIVQQIRKALEGHKSAEMYREPIADILRYDPVIQARMEELREEARQHLERSSKAKKQRAAYDPSWTPDAVLFDKKK